MRLTDKQRVFVAEYLIDLNATQAAIRAGYSERTARSQGSENLAKPDIQSAIAVAMKERGDRLSLSGDFVVSGLREVVTRSFENKGEEFDPKAAVKALELLGRHLGMFEGASKI